VGKKKKKELSGVGERSRWAASVYLPPREGGREALLGEEKKKEDSGFSKLFGGGKKKEPVTGDFEI